MIPGKSDTEVEILIKILAGEAVESIAREKVGESPAIDRLNALLEEKERIGEDSLDAERLTSLAIRHRVTYQVLQHARRHEGLIPEKQMGKLEEHARRNAVRSLKQLHELIRIAFMFNGKGISWACIKGPQLSRMLYGREALKESVDLDLMLLESSELNNVHQGLKEMGYGHSNLDDYRTVPGQKLFLLAKREVHYFNPEKGVHLDLHVRAAANAYVTISRHIRLFRELTIFDLEGTPVPILPPEQYLNFLCHHGAVHQFSSLGWLMDVRHFIRQMKGEMDFTRVQRIAAELGTIMSLWLSFVLLHEIFGDELPVPIHFQGRQGRRIRHLASACRRRWAMDTAASLSLKGRADRFRYLMLLSEGLATKADFVAGILLRYLTAFLRKLGM